MSGIHFINLKDPGEGFAEMRKIVSQHPNRKMIGAIGSGLLMHLIERNHECFDNLDRFEAMVLHAIVQTLEDAKSNDDEILAAVFESKLEQREQDYKKFVKEQKQKHEQEKQAETTTE